MSAGRPPRLPARAVRVAGGTAAVLLVLEAVTAVADRSQPALVVVCAMAGALTVAFWLSVHLVARWTDPLPPRREDRETKGVRR